MAEGTPRKVIPFPRENRQPTPEQIQRQQDLRAQIAAGHARAQRMFGNLPERVNVHENENDIAQEQVRQP